MPSTFHLTEDRRIFCGADYSYGITLKDGAGAAIDLTNATMASQIRRTQASSEVLASFTVTITNAAQGKATLALSAASTATLPATPTDSYWKHDVLLTRADGVKIRILEGDVEVDAAVTR
jgi:hypothetical protein